ncbi:unnamed protein product [Blepharisma stoltei]|uniref:Uncharacterized protein n=1 Tax=Blepharisma stoltei TaxID=1481888 RepID=A0AAU9K1D9_9CILI|nr:unnamed protein product [Blepharisma stoltei]
MRCSPNKNHVVGQGRLKSQDLTLGIAPRIAQLVLSTLFGILFQLQLTIFPGGKIWPRREHEVGIDIALH